MMDLYDIESDVIKLILRISGENNRIDEYAKEEILRALSLYGQKIQLLSQKETIKRDKYDIIQHILSKAIKQVFFLRTVAAPPVFLIEEKRRFHKTISKIKSGKKINCQQELEFLCRYLQNFKTNVKRKQEGEGSSKKITDPKFLNPSERDELSIWFLKLYIETQPNPDDLLIQAINSLDLSIEKSERKMLEFFAQDVKQYIDKIVNFHEEEDMFSRSDPSTKLKAIEMTRKKKGIYNFKKRSNKSSDCYYLSTSREFEQIELNVTNLILRMCEQRTLINYYVKEQIISILNIYYNNVYRFLVNEETHFPTERLENIKFFISLVLEKIKKFPSTAEKNQDFGTEPEEAVLEKLNEFIGQCSNFKGEINDTKDYDVKMDKIIWWLQYLQCAKLELPKDIRLNVMELTLEFFTKTSSTYNILEETLVDLHYCVQNFHKCDIYIIRNFVSQINRKYEEVLQKITESISKPVAQNTTARKQEELSNTKEGDPFRLVSSFNETLDYSKKGTDKMEHYKTEVNSTKICDNSVMEIKQVADNKFTSEIETSKGQNKSLQADNNLVIGIDLGTTNSCASFYMNGKMKVVENFEGQRVTPSSVFLQDKRWIVGEQAKKMADWKPESAVYEVKRLIGRKFDDPNLQKKLTYFSFNIENDGENNPIILIKNDKDTIKKTPKEICSIILQNIKNYIEDKFDTPIKKAVITVPAYFNVHQREATLAAAKDAGFTVLKLLNEPTAAALVYYHEREEFSNGYSMVYDLGGGTFDVALLKRSNKNIEIISVDGDTELGGQDFDNIIMDYVCDEIKKKYKCHLTKDKQTIKRMHIKCEEAKVSLSTIEETVIFFAGLIEEQPKIEITLNRQTLEKLCEKLFQRTIDIVDNCIKSSQVPKNSIKEIILCGGSTRIPKIKEMLSNYFNGKQLNKFINPDEAVSEGAAIQAAMLSTNPKQKIETIKLSDVLPLSLGSASLGYKMNILIKRNSPIPITESMPYSNLHEDETSIKFEIYEGERADVRKNRFLGAMEISDVTPSPPGECKVILTLSVDENSILTVTAKEESKENSRELRVDYARSTRSEKEVKNAVLDSQNFKEEDECFTKFIDQKIYLMRYCSSMAYNLNNQKLTGRHMDIYKLCRDFYNRAEKMEVESEKELLAMINKVQEKCEAYVKKYKFKIVA